jgi:hypothetical protein
MDLRRLSFFVSFCILIYNGSFVTAGEKNATTLPNPILFVAQVPIPNDTITIGSVFGNHQSTTASCGRGGDLCILYPDGTLKNLTFLAGYGNSGLQGAGGIAVRDPSMHWNGTKALLSMVVGAPTSQNDSTQFFWQIYEISGLGEFETPVITKVQNQPQNYNNIYPIYGTDDRIIFVSDRPRNNQTHFYPLIDEYRGQITNAGLYSLDSQTGDLFMIDHAPSGDFHPSIDSYGRLIFTRWDHLQRDSQADKDILQGNTFGTFNYSDESAGASVLAGDRTEVFPEPQASRVDLLAGTNINGMEFNRFFPWQVNEDGTEMETINHVGRHDLNFIVGPPNFNDDPNLVVFQAGPSRTNQNSILNMMELAEDPTQAAVYYGVDANEFGMHSAGQIITLAGAPSLDAEDMFVTFITDRATANPLPENGTPNATFTGHYRDPLPLSNGQLIVAHSNNNKVDKNIGTYSNPVARDTFRLKTMKIRTGSIWMSDQPLIPSGITKNVSYWSTGGLISYTGMLWELNPVEVKSRTIPAKRVARLSAPERAVMLEEGVDTTAFRNYLIQHDLALIVSRNITNRNTFDHQQPFYLKVHQSNTQSPNPSGKVYDVTHMQVYEADYLRGYGLVNGNPPSPGRRVLPVPLNDTSVHNPPNPAGPQGSVALGSDGSQAMFIPAHRAISWQLTDSNGVNVVRERFWVTFAAGEIRTCASCHGSNGEATTPKQIIPQNEPEALHTLLQYWKTNLAGSAPAMPVLIQPADNAIDQLLTLTLSWNASSGASTYRFQLSTDSLFSSVVVDDSTLTDSTKTVSTLSPSTTYFWRVNAKNSFGVSGWSPTWHFASQPLGANQYAMTGSWNLLSLPATVSDGRTSVLFPAAISTAFAYAGNYQQQDSMVPGVGYWLKFASSQVVTISGTLLAEDSISVNPGWNMIGAISSPVAVTSVTSNPPAMITSNFFGHSGSYIIADSLRPAKGYWVKVNASGVLILSSSGTPTPTNRIRIVPSTEMPPRPPDIFADDHSSIPKMFLLGQNYPNPFNPSTVFSYQTPVSGHVRLSIYNTLGEETAIIVNEEQQAGTYSLRWDASRLPSGLYFYKLQIGSFTDVKKLVLMK